MHHRLRRIVVALSFALAAASVHADELQDINRMMKQGQLPQALERIDKYLASKPRDAQGRFLKGLILTNMNRPNEAIQVFKKLSEDYPELPEPYNNLAVLYASQGQYDKARIALESSIRTHPSYATAHENLGDIYAKLASQAYDKALQLDSTNSGAQSKLMLVRSLVGMTPPPVRTAEGKVTQPVVVAAVPPPAVSKPAAPASASPAPPESTPKRVTDPRKEVLAAVEAWALAWSRQDVKAYLAHYAPDFEPPRGEPRSAWEKLRRSRVAGPKSIAVTIKAPKVALESDTAARVDFRQIYRSDRFSATGNKTLDMVKVGGRWLIRREQVGG